MIPRFLDPFVPNAAAKPAPSRKRKTNSAAGAFHDKELILLPSKLLVVLGAREMTSGILMRPLARRYFEASLSTRRLFGLPETR